MKKGTKLNSVSITNNSKKYLKDKKWMYTYNPDDEWDSKVYKGPFSIYLKRFRTIGSSVYEHSYEVVKDLKMPTKTERQQEFKKLYEDNKQLVDDEMTPLLDKVKAMGMDRLLFKDTKGNETKASQLSDRDLFMLFNKAMENTQAFTSTKKYAEIMAQKYDAMVDDFNQGLYNDTHDPVIIFDKSASLKPIKRARAIPMSEMMKYYREVESEQAKKGKGVLL